MVQKGIYVRDQGVLLAPVEDLVPQYPRILVPDLRTLEFTFQDRIALGESIPMDPMGEYGARTLNVRSEARIDGKLDNRMPGTWDPPTTKELDRTKMYGLREWRTPGWNLEIQPNYPFNLDIMDYRVADIPHCPHIDQRSGIFGDVIDEELDWSPYLYIEHKRKFHGRSLDHMGDVFCFTSACLDEEPCWNELEFIATSKEYEVPQGTFPGLGISRNEPELEEWREISWKFQMEETRGERDWGEFYD